MNTEHDLLVTARYWMGQLHDWLWRWPESARNTPKMKELIRDIKRIDRFLKKESEKSAERIAKALLKKS